MHDRDWLRIGPAIKEVALAPLSAADMRAYVSARLGRRADFADVIHAKSGGSPLIAPMLVDGLLTNPGATAISAPHDKLADTISWLLTGVPPESIKEVELCAIPRFFDNRLFRILTSDQKAGTHFDGLAQYGSLFRAVPYGLAMHEDVRITILAHLRWKNRELYCDAHRGVAEFYDAEIQSGHPQPHSALDQLALRLERLYHRLSAGEYRALDDANAIVDLARSRHRPSTIAACIQIVSIVHDLEDAEALHRWLELYRGVLAFESGEWASAREHWHQVMHDIELRYDARSLTA